MSTQPQLNIAQPIIYPDGTMQPPFAVYLNKIALQSSASIEGIIADVAANTSAVATNTGDIAANTGSIATNTGDIATNTAAIAALAKSHASFYTTTGGVTAVGATAKRLVIGSTRINSGDCVLASNEVTVNKTANFQITLDCYLNSSGTSRCDYAVYLEIDNGFGWAEVTASRSFTYQRGYDTGMTSSINLIMAVTTGDTFRASVIRTAGGGTTAYQGNNGTRLTFLEV